MTSPDLATIRSNAFAALAAAKTLPALEDVRVRWLGRQGPLTDVLKSLKDLPIAERRTVGSAANALRQELEAAMAKRRAELLSANTPPADLTLPGIMPNVGFSHPLRRMMERIEKIFAGLGYEIATGPEVETERYNFDLLNVPKDHPARDVQDTFYLSTRGFVLRTHTSPVQIRAMESRKPPVRFLVPGRVYRQEATDASHEASFFQTEGLVIDRGIRLTDLLGTLSYFLKSLFGSSVKLRFRPHFYSFTEPSLDADMSCLICGGKGCSTCGGHGWLEMLGAGMVHPTVLKNMGVDPTQYSGFAFGMGVDRLMMLYEGVGDIRLSYSGDLRFLERVRL